MANSVRGIIHFIGDTQEIGQKGFRKRIVALEQENGQFTNYVPIEFTKDNCDAVDDMNVGDEIDIQFFISGRKWQKTPNDPVQYFVALQASRWTVLSSAGAPANVDVEDTPEFDYLPDDNPF